MLVRTCGYIVVLQCVGNLVTRLLQPCNKVVTISNPRFLPGCHKLVTRLSQPGDKVGTTIYYNLVTTVLQPCNKVVTISNPRFLPGCHNLVTRLSQPSTTTLLFLYGYYGDIYTLGIYLYIPWEYIYRGDLYIPEFNDFPYKRRPILLAQYILVLKACKGHFYGCPPQARYVKLYIFVRVRTYIILFDAL